MTNYREIYERFIDMFDGIANGTVKVFYSKKSRSSDTYFDENFTTDNGWEFSYFDDNGDWDGLTSIRTPDLQSLSWEEINDWNKQVTEEQQDYRISLMNFNPDEKTYKILYTLSLHAGCRK